MKEKFLKVLRLMRLGVLFLGLLEKLALGLTKCALAFYGMVSASLTARLQQSNGDEKAEKLLTRIQQNARGLAENCFHIAEQTEKTDC